MLEAQGSVLTNKYAEGYPGRRYYGGCEFVDVAEQLAIDRARRLFDCAFANVQPHSGASANLAVFLALLQPGDTILGMSLAAGGHLSHGAPPNVSGKWFEARSYGVRQHDQRIDFDEVAELAEDFRPKLIIAGGSAYPRLLDFARFREIADAVGAYLMVDMAHIAGLVAAGVHPSPFPHAHVVTSTTHKTLRGPRGGLILTRRPGPRQEAELGDVPGPAGRPADARDRRQGGRLRGSPAAGFQGLRPQGGRERQGARRGHGRGRPRSGRRAAPTSISFCRSAAQRADRQGGGGQPRRAGITCNMNSIPFDPEKRTITSGIRLGSPAATTRGFGIAEFQETGHLIVEVLDGLAANPDDNRAIEDRVRDPGRGLCAAFPIYGLGPVHTAFASGPQANRVDRLATIAARSGLSDELT